MATTYQVKTFEDIYTAILEELGIQSSDTVALNRIKRDINSVYLEEICPESRWSWLRKTVDLEHAAYISTGTCTVTSNSNTVTLTSAPSYSVQGYYFVGGSFSEVYKVNTHSAGSTTLTLHTKYNGTTSSTASYRLWPKSVPLPANCRETIEVRHDFRGAPLEARGFQDFQKLESLSPRATGRPIYYCTGDWVDPDDYTLNSSLPATSHRSSAGLIRTIRFANNLRTDTSDVTTRLLNVGDRIRITGSGSAYYNVEGVVSSITSSGSTTATTDNQITFTATTQLQESATADTGMSVMKKNIDVAEERYRELLLFPSAHDVKTTLHVSYIIEPPALTDDDDEPLMPISDRMVLVYGAASRAWSRYRKQEDYIRTKQEFQNRLTKMKGKTEDSVEFAKVMLSKDYLYAKRRGRTSSTVSNIIDSFGGGGSGSSVPTGTANTVAIFDATGDLGPSPTISTTELNYLNGVGSTVVGISDTNTLTNKTIAIGSNTITGTASRVAIFNASGTMEANAALSASGIVYADATAFPATQATKIAWDATNFRFGVGDLSSTSIAIAGSTLGNKATITHDGNTDSVTEAVIRASSTAGNGARIVGARSKGTLAAPTVVASSDTLMSIQAAGHDGTDFALSSGISFEVDTTPGAGDMPGRIVFRTSPDGSETLTEAFRVNRNQESVFSGSVYLGLTIGAEHTILTNVALSDNSALANVFTYSATAYEAAIVEYSIARGAGNREVGQLLIATDGSTVNMSQASSVLGTVGVTLSADISGGSVRVRYTSTSTGTAPTFKYIMRRWDA